MGSGVMAGIKEAILRERMRQPTPPCNECEFLSDNVDSIKLSPDALYCEKHDKLIMKKYPPTICKDRGGAI